MPARYTRMLNDTFLRLMMDSKLSELVATTNDSKSMDCDELDWQVRADNRLIAYHGTARLLTIRQYATTGLFEVSAAKAFSDATNYGNVMSVHPVDRIEQMVNLIAEYLPSAIALANVGHFRNQAKGYWLNRVAQRFGRRYRSGDPWLVIDRESMVGFASHLERQFHVAPIQVKYQAYTEIFQLNDSKVEPGEPPIGNECDLLAISSDGRLLCCELHHGSNPEKIYQRILRAAICRDLLRQTVNTIWPGICNLLRQKVALKLLPEEALSLVLCGGVPEVSSMLVISDLDTRSQSWACVREFAARCPEVATSACGIIALEGDLQVSAQL